MLLQFSCDDLAQIAMHIHQNEDEHFIILEGTARIASGDKTFDAAAGTTVSLSKGVPHAWCNLSDSPLRMVVIASPGGIEEILRFIAKGGDTGIMALSEKFGVRNIGPMLSSQLMSIVRSTQKDMKPESAYGCQVTCRVVGPSAEFVGKQALLYAPGISAESVGAHAIHLQVVTIPAGGRAKAHRHDGHEAGIYILSGESGMWYGERLEEHLGHLNPNTTPACQLQSRNHEVVFKRIRRVAKM